MVDRSTGKWTRVAVFVEQLVHALRAQFEGGQLAVEVAPHAVGQARVGLQHGQQVRAAPKALLARAGFVVREPAEAHLCCGSAGTYNMLQPDIAARLRDRKAANLEAAGPDIIAAGNIGCITQIASATGIPVLHTVELLDWAYGGPAPAGVALRAAAAQ